MESQENPLTPELGSQTPVQPSESEQKTRKRERDRRLQKVWLARITAEEKAHKDARDRMREVEDVYNSNLGTDNLYVPLYWQVVNVQHVGVYSAQPVPDVRPRNETDNPVFRQVARMIGRALSYCVDDQSFDFNLNRSIDDYLSVGMGVPRVKVNSVITQTDSGQVNHFNQPVMQEEVKDQTINWEYVPWGRFGWQACNSWSMCDFIYFRHRMTQAQIRAKFGRTVKASKDENDRTDPNSWQAKTFDIYEVWDRKARKVLFIGKGESVPVKVVDDPLGLIDFYPIPMPMMLNLPSEEMIPKPDYDFIEHYDKELNRLQERRMGLLEQIKAAGAYDKGLPELKGMMELEDGQMLSVQNLIGRLGAVGGADAAFYWLPIKEKVEALVQLTQQIQFVKSQVDEVLGIADIVMGTTKASESATAQDIKGRWVGIRLTRKRECVQYTVREMLRIMAQLLGSHITPENLQRMTQMQMTEQMMEIFKSDTLMDFMIDIETESTVAKDEEKERRTHQEMLNGVAQYSQSVLPMVAQGLMPADVSSAILKTALTPYSKYNRGLDEALGNLQTSQQQLQQMNQKQQQTDQQLQQVGQQMEQWKQIAQKLQMEATQAKSLKEQADAGKKRAETAEIVSKLPDHHIQPLKTAAEVANIEADTRATNRNQNSGAIQYRRTE